MAHFLGIDWDFVEKPVSAIMDAKTGGAWSQAGKIGKQAMKSKVKGGSGIDAHDDVLQDYRVGGESGFNVTTIVLLGIGVYLVSSMVR